MTAVHVAVTPLTGHPTPNNHTERHAAAAMPPWRAREFLHGRALLRLVVAGALDVPPDRPVIGARPSGRPVLHGHLAGVSVSHTDRHVAAAVWPDGDVGVDVMEPPDEVDPRLVRRCCGEHVVARPDAAECFARVWAVQEACVKAVGLGLGGLPWRIPVDPDARRGRWRDVRWHLVDTGLPCVLAVAVQVTTRRNFADPRVLVQHPGRSGLHPATGSSPGTGA